MSLKIYNTLSNRKEIFQPLERNKVGIYVCGPTVYNYIHVGNARPMVFFDVVYRYLKIKGYEVTYVRNITDIDDKIIKKSQEEHKTASAVAKFYEEAFNQDMKTLGIQKPGVCPRATEHIDRMIQWIQRLIEKGYAYRAKGEVMFSIEKFKGYGKLSKKKTESLISGARVKIAKHKKNPLDFVLWKSSKPGDPFWESPWGKGRPGWHLECSVMSTKYLGSSFDIHGGGMDLIFPHHENEIAQSEAHTGAPFVKYWMHNGMLAFGREKMSKSLGNIVTAYDFLKKYPPDVLKYILLSNHYRSSLEFSDQTIKKSILALEKIYKMLLEIKIACEKETQIPGRRDAHLKNAVTKLWPAFESEMDDDFNTAGALGAIFDTIRGVNRYFSENRKVTRETKQILTELLGTFKKIGSILGLFEQDPESFLKKLRTTLPKGSVLTTEEIETFIQEREVARKKKDWKRSDEIRDFLKKNKIFLEDTPSGTTWKVEK